MITSAVHISCTKPLNCNIVRTFMNNCKLAIFTINIFYIKSFDNTLSIKKPIKPAYQENAEYKPSQENVVKKDGHMK